MPKHGKQHSANPPGRTRAQARAATDASSPIRKDKAQPKQEALQQQALQIARQQQQAITQASQVSRDLFSATPPPDSTSPVVTPAVVSTASAPPPAQSQPQFQQQFDFPQQQQQQQQQPQPQPRGDDDAVRDASPAPVAPSFVAAVAGSIPATNPAQKVFKIRPELREALKAAKQLEVVGASTAFVPFGSKQSAIAGHNELRSYDAYRQFKDVDAFLEGCPKWLLYAVMSARTCVIFDRSLCGQSAIAFVGGLAPRGPATAGTTSPFKGWRKRVRFITVLPAHMLAMAAPRALSLGLTLNSTFNISGPTARVNQFAVDHKLTLLRSTTFGEELHCAAELSAAQVKLAFSAGLLAMEVEAIATSNHSQRMLTLDFKMSMNAAAIHTAVHTIAVAHGCQAAVVNFRGRLLFAQQPVQPIVEAIAKTPGLLHVRKPYVTIFAELPDAPEAQQADSDEPVLPTQRPTTPCLLVQAHVLLPASWLKSLVDHLGPTCKVVQHDGAQALISCSAELADKYDNVVIQDALLLSKFERVLADRAAADARMRASVERATAALQPAAAAAPPSH